MRITCRVRWIDGDSSDCILLVNTASYNDGVLRIYLVENNDYFYAVPLTPYESHSLIEKLLVYGYADLGKTVDETLWEDESVVIK